MTVTSFLKVPSLLEEVHVMRQALKKDQGVQGPHRIFEKTAAPYERWASHTRQSAFDHLSRSDRLLDPRRSS